MQGKRIWGVVVILIPLFIIFGCASVQVKETLGEADAGLIVFKSINIDDRVFRDGGTKGSEQEISGRLKLPPGKGEFPAVIIIHGSGGVDDNHRNWANLLNKMGIATFILDSFSYRKIGQIYTGASTISTGSCIVDIYRAVELLRTHPSIDGSRISLMGFSMGGSHTLMAAMIRFQKVWLSSEASIAAYLAIYPPTWRELKEFEKVGGRPIRIFVGTADDWTPAERARDYIEKLQSAGQDAEIHEYPNAHHGFDQEFNRTANFIPNAINLSKCHFKEVTIGGDLIDPITNEKLSLQASCIIRGATCHYNGAAHRQAIKDVEAFLKEVKPAIHHHWLVPGGSQWRWTPSAGQPEGLNKL